MKIRAVFKLWPLFLIPLLFSACLEQPSTVLWQKCGMVLWQKPPAKTVYLTFDDGPDKVNTPKVLDILKKYNVRATFFVLGHKSKACPDIIKRINAEGHVLGNHTFSHIDGTVIDEEKIKNELESTHAIILAACGQPVKIFRPPFGFFNWRVFKLARAHGYKILLWTFDLSDWSVHSAESYRKTVADNLTDGAIILLHDGGPKREALLAALPKIIELIRARGFSFGTNL
jgi:peptidoglycan/xylan/chitin deacetylase (PgdA/CDA1 family)